MFNSCRFCHRPTDKWQDFCNECALSGPPPPFRVIRGGKPFLKHPKEDSAGSRQWPKLVRPRSRPPESSY